MLPAPQPGIRPDPRNFQIPSAPTIPGSPNSAPSDEVRLQFPNTDIQPIIKLYEQLTGKHVISDNTVVGTISIDISRPVGRDEAIRIIETSLYLNGFALVPTEGDIVKLVGAGKNPRNFGVNIYSDVSEIPDGIGIVSVVFQLQYADSKDIKAVVDQYLSNSIYTSSVPLPGAIIVTESSVNLRNIAKIIAAADVPPAEVVSQFYLLQRATAKDVVDKLTKLFDKSIQSTESTTMPTNRQFPGQPPMPPGSAMIPASASGLSEDTIIVGKIKVDYDERTNRVHIVTRPVNLPFIQELMDEYDSAIEFGTPVKRMLEHVNAADILSVVVRAITEPGETAVGDTGPSSPSSTSGGNGSTGPSANTGVNSGFNGGGEGGSVGSEGGGGLSIPTDLQTTPPDLTPKSVTIGNTKIIADPRQNCIIVLGNDDVKRKIFTLLDQLDVPTPEVMIDTVIGEYTLNNDSNFGVDYLLHYPSGPLAGILGSGTSTPLAGNFLNGNNGAAITNFTNIPLTTNLGSAIGAGSGITAAIGAASSLDIIVNALESTGRFHVTNRPMVFAENNKQAMIVSGEQIPVPTSTLSNLTSTGEVGSTAAVQSSINYIQVALQLEVVPLINSNKDVNLDILQELNSPGATSNVGGTEVPAINTRYIRTNVTVANKSTVILGGLITRTTGGNTSGVPYLSRIPLLGYLFGNKTKQNDRSELIILIRPVVTTSADEVSDETHVERNRLLMQPDIDSTITPPDHHSANNVNFRYEDDGKSVQ